MSVIEILAVIAIIGFVIYQQVAGQFLRGRRVRDGRSFMADRFTR